LGPVCKRRCDKIDDHFIDYRSWHHWIADDHRISKMPLIFLKSQLLIWKIEKGALAGLSIANPKFFEIATFCRIVARTRKSRIQFSGKWWLSVL
jgi:hypothetical protein